MALDRIEPRRGYRLIQLVLLLGIWSTLALAGDAPVPAQPLWVRLAAPVCSYSAKTGDPVHAILTEEVRSGGEVVFPMGTPIEGVVRSVHKVGWGIRHETATLQLEFTEAKLQGTNVPISATVSEVENAREEVKRGVIEGVISSNTPQGRITSRYKYLPTWDPYTDLGLIAFKATFPIFPEPEIYLPSGTDLRLNLTTDLASAAIPHLQLGVRSIDPAERWEMEQLARTLPQHSTTKALVDADLLNLIFVGSRQQVESAFQQAGWNTTDPNSKRAVMREFYAFLNQSDYPRAPMRSLLLNGKPADMNFQKSLNIYAKRDHLRVWQGPVAGDGQALWLSSSTHDTGAGLSVKYHRFVHHITPDIDEERSKVVRDLKVAGCVKAEYLVRRPAVSPISQNATGDPIRTDGSLAIVELQDCQPSQAIAAPVASGTQFKAGNRVFRYARRQILTFRSDIWRANIVYGAYELGSMAVSAMRHHPVPAMPPDESVNALVPRSTAPPVTAGWE